MAEFKISRLRFTWKGTWASNTFYNRDAIVEYNGKTFDCLVPHTSSDFYNDLAETPIPYWNLQAEGKTWKGNWEPSTYYSNGNIVKFGGATYFCNLHHTSTTEFVDNQSNWSILSEGDNWKGVWAPSTNYGIGDIIRHGGNVYRCNAAHFSSSLTIQGFESDVANWDVYVSGLEFRGTWSPSSQYSVNELVKVGPDIWKCTIATPPSATFDDTKFTLFLPGEEIVETWSSTTTYQLGDTVSYGGYEYYSIISNNLNNVPSITGSQPAWNLVTTGYTPAGVWNSSTTYKVGSVVQHGGQSFIAIADNTTANPLNNYIQATYNPTGSSGTTIKLTASYGSDPTKIVVGQIVLGNGFKKGQTVVSTSDGGLTVILNEAPDSTPSGTLTFVGVDSSKWQLLTPGVSWRGFWEAGNNYLIGDLVLWQNATYRCVQYHSSLVTNSPVADTSNNFWVVYLLHARNNASSTVGDITTYNSGIYTNVNIGPTQFSLRVTNGLPTWRMINRLSNVYYVATTGVDDPSRGITIDSPWKTIAYACQTILNGTINQNASYLLKANKEFIVAEMYQWMLNQKTNSISPFTPSSTFDETKTKRDARYVLDAIVYDITRGGNSQTVAATLAFFENSSKFVNTTVASEMPFFIAALNYLTTLVNNVLNNASPTYNYQTINSVAPGSIVSQVINTNYTSETGQIAPDNNSTITVTNNGSSSYSINGTNKVTLNLVRGYTYTFSVNATGHPFFIQTSAGGYNSNKVYTTGILNSGVDSGNITFAVPYSAPSTLYYQCQVHTGMWGTINIYDNSASVPTVPSAANTANALLGILTSALTDTSTSAVPTPNDGIASTIFVKSGTYQEILPITVPANVALFGDELRSVTIEPATSYIGITTSSSSSTSSFNVISTIGLSENMPVQFVGTAFGGITAATTYYVVGSSITATSFAVSTTVNGNAVPLVNGIGSLYIYAGDSLKNMFYMRNGSGLRNLTLSGLMGTLTPLNQYFTKRPTGGAYVSLDPGTGPNDTTAWIFRRSPYIQNVTTFGQGCTGLKVDGDLHNGGYKSIVANDFTQIISDGIGAWITGSDAKSELISVFTYYAYAGYFAEAGGRIRAANGNCSYGSYGAIAEGYDTSETPLTGVVYNRSTQVQASVQSSLGINAQLLKLQYANAGKNYTRTTTNLLYYSNNFVNGVWTTDNNVGFTKNTVAPTGFVEAWALSTTATSTGSSYLQQAITITPSGATYNGLSGTNLSGSGVGATFNVTVTGNNSYSVVVNSGGLGYVVGNQIKILGSVLGGLDVVNDLTITVSELTSSTISKITSTGTTPVGSSKPYLVSAYIKQGTASNFDVYATFSGSTSVSSALNFNFSTNVATPTIASPLAGTVAGSLATSYGAIPLTNGWYRVWFTVCDTIGLNNSLTITIFPGGYTARNLGAYSYLYGTQVQSDTTTASLSFYLETTNKIYTSYANFEITGSGSGAVIQSDEIRSSSVFESRIISGGSNYLTASNNAQGGTNTYIILAQSDNNTLANYIGMRVFITSGTGTGQYGFISDYNTTTKIVQVLKESFTPLNISSTSSSTNAFTLSTGDTTQMYVNQQVQFIPTYYRITTTNSSQGSVSVSSTTGGTINKLTATSTANLQLYMPITFSGTVFGSITTGYTYYVAYIDPNGTDFKVSTTQYGSLWPLTTETGTMTVNFPTNTGYLTGSTTNMTVNMPVVFEGAIFGGVSTATTYYINDIINSTTYTIANSLVTITATDTTTGTNVITAPTGSLVAFNPIVFSGTTFGNIVSGTKYFINKIVNSSTFTVASSLLYTSASATQAISNLITVTSTSGFVANAPIRFTGTTFGGLTVETTYYILAINDGFTFTISSTPGGSAVNLTTGVGNLIVRTTTGDFALTTASGSMTGTSTGTKRLSTAASGSMTATISTSLYGGISANTNYYIKDILSSSTFTITATSNGATAVTLTTATGNMSVAAVGWDHIIPGYPIAALLDNSSIYFIEPRTIYSEPAYSQVSRTIISQGGSSYTAVGYGNNYFLAIAANSATAALSTNGINWSSVAMPSAAYWTDIAYGNNYWVAIAAGTNIVAYSSANGQGWRTSTLPVSTGWSHIDYGMNMFVAIGNSGSNVAYSTNNGQTWAAGTSLPSATWASICYGGGIFVAVATGGTQAAYSTDGIAWNSTTLPESTNWIDVVYGNGRFVAVSSSNTYSAYSFDGITWYSSNLKITATRISYGQGVFVVVNSGSSTAYTSDDGANWRQRTVTSAAYSGITFGYTSTNYDGVFVTVAGANICSNIFAGVSAKGRAVVTAGSITSMNLWESGSNYTSIPTITYTDPNNTSDTTITPRLGNGTLGNPTIINKGSGYSLNNTYITITGNGYADSYQLGYTLILNNLTRIPNPGDDLTIDGISTIFKVSSASIMFGTTAPNIEANVQISPNLTADISPADETAVSIRQKYSQVRLTGHDFLNIGYGNIVDSNYPTEPVVTSLQPQNQTVENNFGRVFYATSDQDGNFKVGNLFGVQQSTGIVTLSASQFGLTGLSTLSLGGIAVGGSSVIISQFSTDSTLAANSDNVIPTQRAIKTYVASRLSQGGANTFTGNLIAGSISVGNPNYITNQIPVGILGSSINMPRKTTVKGPAGAWAGGGAAYFYFVQSFERR